MNHLSRRPRHLFVATAVGLAIGLAGCSSEDVTEGAVNRAIEADGGSGRVDLDDGEITMTDGDNTVSMGGGDLPDGYPQNFPVFDPSAAPTVAMTLDDVDQAVQRMMASYVFQTPATEVAEWYEGALEAAGFEVTDPYDANTSTLRFEGHGWTGGIGIFDQGSQTSINIALERPLD